MKANHHVDSPVRHSNASFVRSMLWVFVGAIALPVGVSYGLAGKSATEKLLTAMAQPLFVSIIALMAVAITLMRCDQRRLGLLLFGIAACLWLSSCRAVVDNLFQRWEERVPLCDLESADPLDYLVVLGGGSSASPDGRAQLGEAGDRIAFAAALFLKGQTKHLVTTGDSLRLSGIAGTSQDSVNDPSQQTIQLWTRLGIPTSVISELPGENTSAEMAALKSHPEWWENKRCGLLTSAFHMPRALKLAQAQGVNVIPVAADFRISPSPLLVKDFFPDARDLYRLEILMKEWLGMLIGR
jgi:uncharacterized SAM-binding protein YcdF (DUF218 family)